VAKDSLLINCFHAGGRLFTKVWLAVWYLLATDGTQNYDANKVLLVSVAYIAAKVIDETKVQNVQPQIPIFYTFRQANLF